MTARLRRLLDLAPLAAALLLALALVLRALAQPAPPATSPLPREATKAGPIQTGLPPELVLLPAKLDAEQKRLESARGYLQMSKPPSGIGALPGKVSGWLSGLFSGKKKPRDLTVGIIVEASKSPTTANQLTGQLVSVEGLYRKAAQKGPTGPQDVLVEGTSKLPLAPWAGVTSVTGFDPGGPDGMPALAVGTVVMQSTGPVLQVQQVTPAPTLTLVRLARLHDLRDDIANYREAVDLYRTASTTSGPGASVWGGFAMAHGGQVAEEKLRDRKAAITLYNMAWTLEGRVAQRKAPTTIAPQTWVLVDKREWQSTPLRQAVGKPLDALESTGFWYKFVHAIVAVSGGNAGIGMILLAVVTRLLLWPLTRKQLESARAMQKLQPQIKALQQKHGSDKQKFQEDFWKLCRANKVNPLGGCLPLVIQMPLLWAVYSGVRAYTVQLSHYHFLWIRSLADPDLPLLVLYTISMVAFQKVTTKNQPVADPQQQQQQNMMVWMMPLMFFVFFQGIASGFILYWLGTNLIYLPQQYLATRTPKEQKDEDEAGKERVITLEPGSSGPRSQPTVQPDPSLLGRLRSWISGEKPAEEGNSPPSYEQKKADEKREQRRSTRKRKRRP